MFKSATLRLTGWYMLILLLISGIFSVVIYQVASSEVQTRLERFQTNLQASQAQDTTIHQPVKAETMRADEEQTAATNLTIQLLYINLFVLVIGGFISYWLARRSLLPIEKAHASQSRFTSDASHELRTPLAAMRAEIEVALRDKNANADNFKQILASNLEEVNKLSRLSEMLLNLSRLDNANLKMTPVNLDKIVRGTVKMFCSNPERIKINSSIPLTHIVKANEMAITDLVKVLVDNAMQYSPKDSVIKINLSKQDNYIIFTITNSGAGIQPEKMAHIFERFYRADSSRTDGKHKSYGLGLALAKNIVDLHHGRLLVTSAPDQETTFTFMLPLNNHNQAKTKV